MYPLHIFKSFKKIGRRQIRGLYGTLDRIFRLVFIMGYVFGILPYLKKISYRKQKISLHGKRNMKGAALYVIDDHEKYQSSKTSICENLLVKNKILLYQNV